MLRIMSERGDYATSILCEVHEPTSSIESITQMRVMDP